MRRKANAEKSKWSINTKSVNKNQDESVRRWEGERVARYFGDEANCKIANQNFKLSPQRGDILVARGCVLFVHLPRAKKVG